MPSPSTYLYNTTPSLTVQGELCKCEQKQCESRARISSPHNKDATPMQSEQCVCLKDMYNGSTSSHAIVMGTFTKVHPLIEELQAVNSFQKQQNQFPYRDDPPSRLRSPKWSSLYVDTYKQAKCSQYNVCTHAYTTNNYRRGCELEEWRGMGRIGGKRGVEMM